MQEKDVSEADVFTELVVNFIHYMIYLTSDVVWVCDRFCEGSERALGEAEELWREYQRGD